jgi:hypothetical protein
MKLRVGGIGTEWRVPDMMINWISASRVDHIWNSFFHLSWSFTRRFLFFIYDFPVFSRLFRYPNEIWRSQPSKDPWSQIKQSEFEPGSSNPIVENRTLVCHPLPIKKSSTNTRRSAWSPMGSFRPSDRDLQYHLESWLEIIEKIDVINIWTGF